MYQQILNFWFDELKASQWWVKNKDLDELIYQKYNNIHTTASLGELWHWRKTPEGSLAEILILDQFSRNIYRDQAQAFAYDAQALILAQNMIDKDFDKLLTINKRSFAYLPFMHSESVKIHELALKLYNQPGLEENLKFEILHKNIIDRFGRYPHRNAVLNRTSTKEEIEFLKQSNSSF